jgi:hypothetical protein
MDVATVKVMTSMSSEIFDELETVKEAARHLRKHPRTLMRWTRLPDGASIHSSRSSAVSAHPISEGLDRKPYPPA